jgi:Dolichyl-phosphate-mannose-protein mannosyltransferase
MGRFQNFVAAIKKRRQALITAAILGLIATSLYAPLIGWGLPYATASDRTKTFATDEIVPLETLAEMHNTFVVSKPDRNYGYPWWHYFVVSAAQVPYVAYLYLSGGLKDPTPEFPFGFLDPVGALRGLTFIGRSVSLLMAVGIVIAAYFFARTLWGNLAGVITSLLVMLNYLMFYYARTGNLDVPMFFWTSVGVAIFGKIIVDGITNRRMAWLGVFAGLALATKEQAIVVFFPLAILLLLPRFNHPIASTYPLRPLLLGLATFVAAYLIGTGAIVDYQRHFTHTYYLLFEQSRVSVANSYWQAEPRTWAGFVNLLRDFIKGLVSTSSLPVLLTAIAGIVVVWRSSSRRLLVLLLPVAVLFFVLVLPVGLVILRYLLPLTLFISAFAARAILSLRHSPLRVAWVPLLVLLCAWQLLIGADLTYAQYYDNRYAASEFFLAQAKPGDRIEYFGATETLPHLSAQINSRRVAGRIRWTGEFHHGPSVLKYLVEEGPEYVIIIPDWTSRDLDRSADCPPEVYAALLDGSVGYTEVASFPTRYFPFSPLRRPSLDNPSVCPPVRIFARNDVLARANYKPSGSGN